MIKAIIATDVNCGMGYQGTLPWHCPEDLAYFSQLTTGHYVVMGNTTWKSLPVRFRPLPKRENVILTRGDFDPALHHGARSVYAADGLKILFDDPDLDFPSRPIRRTIIEDLKAMDEAQNHVNEQVGEPVQHMWIIGGAEIYKQLLPICDEIHWTVINGEHMCDTFLDPTEYMRADLQLKSTVPLVNKLGNTTGNIVRIYGSDIIS